MRESQDNELNRILQAKLGEYETNVPKSSRDFILTNLKSKPVTSGVGRKVIYSLTAVLLFVGSYFIWNPGDSNNVIRESNLIAPEITEKKLNNVELMPNENTTANLPITAERKSNSIESKLPLQSLENSAVVEARSSIAVDDESVVYTSGDPNSLTFSESSSKELIASEIATDEKTLINSQAEDLLTKSPDKSKSLRFVVGVMPFLNYRRIQPIVNDGTYLSGFKSSGIGDRLGFKASVSVDYEITKNHYLFGGVSYFRYKTEFSYHSNEEIGNISIANQVSENVQGVGLLAGARLPLKVSGKRKQYVSTGFDYQLLIGNYFSLTPKNQVMINVGYANDFDLGNGSVLRLQPGINYSLTKFHYGGVATNPYWIGLEIAYSWKLSAN